MAHKFKVGDRVRVARADSDGCKYLGKEGVVVAINPTNMRSRFHRYVVNYNPPEVQDGNEFGLLHAAFAAWMLEPILRAEDDAWAAGKVKLVTKSLHVEPPRVRETEVHK